MKKILGLLCLLTVSNLAYAGLPNDFTFTIYAGSSLQDQITELNLHQKAVLMGRIVPANILIEPAHVNETYCSFTGPTELQVNTPIHFSGVVDSDGILNARTLDRRYSLTCYPGHQQSFAFSLDVLNVIFDSLGSFDLYYP